MNIILYVCNYTFDDVFVALKRSHSLGHYMRDLYESKKYMYRPYDDENWPPFSFDVVVSVAMITYKEKRTEKQFIKIIKIAERHRAGTAEVDRLTSENEEPSPTKRRRLNYTVFRKLADVFAAFQDNKGIPSKPPKRILIEGAPGIGKTVLAKDIAYRWSIGEILKDVQVLFLLFLRDPKLQQIKTQKELIEFIGMGDLSNERIASYTAQLEDTKHICFLLDGYDEFPDKREQQSFLVDLIHGGAFFDAVIVITSRPNSTLQIHHIIDKKIEILGLPKKERDDYISQSLSDEKRVELERYLTLHPIINGFCYFPLYLAILLFLFDQGTLPESLTEMNDSFIAHTAYRHLSRLHCIPPNTVIKTLKDLSELYPDFVNKLCLLAFNGLVSDKLVFSLEELGDDSFRDDVTKRDETRNGFGLLQVADHYHRKGPGQTTSFNFIHFTIQEYMAACYVSTLSHQEQSDKMQSTFWEHRFSFMWMMYVGLVGIKNSVFVNFISGGNVYQKRSGLKLLDTILKDKRKRLQLFQCYMEVKGSAEMPKTISSMFTKGTVRFAKVTLLPHHVSYLTSFMSTSTMQWTTLDLSSSKLDDAAMNILEQFVVDCTQKVSSITYVDISGNPSSPWCVYCAIISCCQVTSLTLFGDYEHSIKSSIKTLTDSLQRNDKLRKLSLFGISDSDLLSFDETFCFCVQQSLEAFNLSWKKAVNENVLIEAVVKENVLIEAKQGFVTDKMCPNNNALVIKVLNDKSYCATPFFMNASSCNISDLEVAFMAFGLQYNTTLRKLHLCDNKITDNGVMALASSLIKNRTLQDLNISKNSVTNVGVIKLLDSIQINKTLQILNISNLSISDESVEAICSVFKTNDTLLNFSLSKSKISREGSKDILGALQFNSAICFLDISESSMCDEAASILGDCLRNNILKEVNVSGNEISDKGTISLANAIKDNASLCKLNISSNMITSEGLVCFLDAVKQNSNLKLQHLLVQSNNITESGWTSIKNCTIQMSLKIDGSWNKICMQKRPLVIIKTTFINGDNNSCNEEEVMIRDITDAEHRASLISSCLAEDKHVKEIVLTKLELTAKGACKLAKAIAHNDVLENLDISRNIIGDDGIYTISASLYNTDSFDKVNKTLTLFNVSDNNITSEGAKYLAKALESNESLKTLNISHNNISDEGVVAILTSCSCLLSVNLSNNCITRNGAGQITKALQFNRCLTDVNLYENSLTNQVSFHETILDAMEDNITITKLTLPWLHDSNSCSHIKHKLDQLNEHREKEKLLCVF